MLTAITRDVNDGLDNCELTFLRRARIDVGVAAHQHQQYESVLSSLGCDVVSVPSGPGLADSVFIEDTAIVLDEVAVLCRPGVESRRAEVEGVVAVLQKYRTLASIRSPGTLDGGDLLRIGDVIYAGLSRRSNKDGIDQLRGIVTSYGYSVVTVETTKCLHLKSGVSEVALNTLLINPNWISRSMFDDYELIEVDKEEQHAANALRVGQHVIYPSSFPRTMDKLLQRGIHVTPVDVSELQKAEGGVTCCSLILTQD